MKNYSSFQEKDFFLKLFFVLFLAHISFVLAQDLASQNYQSYLKKLEKIPLPKEVIGTSTQGRKVYLIRKEKNPKAPKKVLIIATLHGNEKIASELLYELCQKIQPTKEISYCFLPVANPDGYDKHTRYNPNQVDLNRNYPVTNWEKGYGNKGSHGGSEKETQIIISLLQREKPTFVFDLHRMPHSKKKVWVVCPNRPEFQKSLTKKYKPYLTYVEENFPKAYVGLYPDYSSLGGWFHNYADSQGATALLVEIPRNNQIEYPKEVVLKLIEFYGKQSDIIKKKE